MKQGTTLVWGWKPPLPSSAWLVPYNGFHKFLLPSKKMLGFNYSNNFLLNNFNWEPNKKWLTSYSALGKTQKSRGKTLCISNYGILLKKLFPKSSFIMSCLLCILQFQRPVFNGWDAKLSGSRDSLTSPASKSSDALRLPPCSGFMHTSRNPFQRKVTPVSAYLEFSEDTPGTVLTLLKVKKEKVRKKNKSNKPTCPAEDNH